MGLFDVFRKKTAAAVRSVEVAAKGAGAIAAPIAGQALQLTETTEPLFSTEALGKGIAIQPADSTVFAPISGKVTVLMPHAVGITSSDGIEVLVHIGVETVNMKGDGFTSLVAKDDEVVAGQALVDFDAKKIADAGCEDTVFVIVTNTAELAEVAPIADGPVKAGDLVVTARK